MAGTTRCFGIVLLIAASCVNSALVKDPKELCSIKEPGGNKCLQDVLQRVLPNLVKGIPKYGIFPIDPLHINLLDLSHSPGRTLDVRHKFMDVDIIGLGSTTVKAVRATNITLDIDAVLKKPVILKGNYVSVGKVLSLPVNGAGPFTVTLHDMIATLKFVGHQEKKKGKLHYKMDKVQFPFTVSKMSMDFKNLFKGNPQISDAINDALNQSWEAVLDDMKPSFELAIGEAFKEITNRALIKIPTEELIRGA